MPKTTFVCAAVVVAGLLGSVGSATAQQKETETVNRTVPFPDKGVLKLHNFSGPVRITTTTGRDVVIKAVRRAERSRLDTIKLDITTSGSTVTIEANQRDSAVRDRDGENVVETEFDIQVPGVGRARRQRVFEPVDHYRRRRPADARDVLGRHRSDGRARAGGREDVQRQD